MKKYQQGDVVMFQVDKKTYDSQVRGGDNKTMYVGGTKTKRRFNVRKRTKKG